MPGFPPTIRSARSEAAEDPERSRHAVPDPPAVLQHAQSLGGARRAEGYAEGARHRLHRLHAACPGHADRQVSEGHSRRQPRRAGQVAEAEFLNEQAIAHINKLNEIAQPPGTVAGPDGAGLGAARWRVTTALIGASRPEQVIDCVGPSGISSSRSRTGRDRQICPTRKTSICGRYRPSRKRERRRDDPQSRSCPASIPTRPSAGSARITISRPRPSSGIRACRSTIRGPGKLDAGIAAADPRQSARHARQPGQLRHLGAVPVLRRRQVLARLYRRQTLRRQLQGRAELHRHLRDDHRRMVRPVVCQFVRFRPVAVPRR
jgi:hypothetical protein